MFNLRKLEERIVLDGAAIADALDEIHEHEQYEQEVHHALEAHNTADWDYNLDFDEPLYLTDGPDVVEDIGLRVLVISSDIDDGNDLADAAKDDVLVVRYDASDTTAGDLARKISDELGGRKAESIAFAAHNARLDLDHAGEQASDSLLTDAEKDFWKDIGNLLGEDGRIDLLGCNVAADDLGGQIVGEIEAGSGRAVAASDDVTANAPVGDWELESGGVNAGDTYFDADRLGNFDGRLAAAYLTDPPPFPDSDVPDAKEGEYWEFTIPAGTWTVPDGGQLYYWSYAPDHRPSWTSFVGNTLYGTPPLDADRGPDDPEAAGTASMMILGSDNNMDGEVLFLDVTVQEVNETPLVTDSATLIAPDDAKQHEAWSYKVPPDVFEDPEGKVVTYSATNMPAGMTFETDTFYWTPDGPVSDHSESDIGTHTVTLVGSDGTRSMGYDFDVTVLDTNDPAYIKNPLATDTFEVMQGEEWHFTIPPDTFEDPEGELPIYYWSYAPDHHPTWMSFDSGTGTFSGKPPLDFTGTANVIMLGSDSDMNGTPLFIDVVVVDQDFAPTLVGTIDSPIEMTQGDVSKFTIESAVTPAPDDTTPYVFVDYDTGDSIRFHAEDVTDENNPIIIGAEGEHPWITLNKGTGEFTFSPEDQETVTHNLDGDRTASPVPVIRVFAIDSDGDESTSVDFQLTVNDRDDDAILMKEIPTQYVDQGETLVFTIPAGTWIEPDGQELHYWSYAPDHHPTWMSLDGSTFTMSPTEQAHVGTAPVIVLGSDPDMNGQPAFFDVVVNDVPETPPEIHGIAGESMTYTEGEGPVILDRVQDPGNLVTASVTDPDFPVAGPDFKDGYLEVEITNGLAEDVLDVNTSGGEIGFYDGQFVTYQGNTIGVLDPSSSSNTLLKINLTTTDADPDSVGALIRNITYENTNAKPDLTPRTVEFSLADGDGGIGGTAGEYTMAVTITDVNSAPVIENFQDDTQTYQERGSAVPIDTGDPVTIIDGDNDNFNGGSLDIQIASGFRTGDQLLVDADIGTVTVGETGSLHVDFKDGVTPAQVESFISAVTFQSTDTANPPEGDRQIRITLTDGDPAAGGETSDPVFSTVTVEKVNTPPVITNMNDGTPNVFQEGGSPVLIDAGTPVTLEDADTSVFDSGKLRVEIINSPVLAEDKLSIRNEGANYQQIALEGSTVKYGNQPFGTVAFPADGVMEVTFNDSASPDAVQALLRNVTYENTEPNAPTPGERTVSFQVWDGELSNSESNIQEMKVDVDPVNDSPVLSGIDAGDNLVYSEGQGKAILDSAPEAIVTDIDSPNFNGGYLEVRIVDGGVTTEDVLSLKSGMPAYAADDGSDSGEGLLKIKFTADAATTTAVSDLIHDVVYENVNTVNAATSQRTIEFTVYDGDYQNEGDGGTSNTLSMTVNVAPTNNPPQIHQLEGDVLGYDENDSATAEVLDLAQDAYVSDIDGNEFSKLTVEFIEGFEASEDWLAVQDEPGEGVDRIAFNEVTNEVTHSFKTIGTASYDDAAGVLEIDLNENATTQAVSKLIQNITYSNTNPNDPSTADRSVRFTLWDTDDTGNLSDSRVTKITVTSKNDAPVIDNVDGNVTYIEGNDPVILDADGNALVSDVDSDDFNGGKLKVWVVDPDAAEDRLDIDSEGAIFADGSYVAYNSEIFGKSTFDSNSGILTIDFTNENATSDAVSALIQNITYWNENDENPSGERTVRFQMTDGDPIAAETSEIREVTVSIEPTNDAPSITNLGGDSLFYAEADSIKLVDVVPTAAVVTDADGGTLENGILTITVLGPAGEAGEDVLGISSDSSGGLSVFGDVDKNVVYNGAAVGTYSYDPVAKQLVMNLDDGATTDAVSAVINQVTYNNMQSLDPTPGDRTVRFTLTDGLDSAEPYDVTIQMEVTNDAPVIENVIGDGASYVENALPVILNPDAVVTDADNDTFDSGYLEVQITNGDTAEDELSINNQGLSAGQIGFADGINVSYAGDPIGVAQFISETGILTVNLKDNATPDAVSALMQNITYENTDDAITPGVRQVSFMVDDGNVENATSLVNTMSLTVTAVNDQPMITNLDGDVVTFYEDGGGTDMAVFLDAGTDAVVSDADESAFTGGTLKIEIDGYVDGEDKVEFKGAVPGTVDTLSSDGVLTVTFDASADATSITELIHNVYYYNTDSLEPTLNDRTMRFTLDDGSGADNATSDEYSVTVKLVPENDAPELIGIAGSTTYIEDNNPVMLASTASVSDDDSPVFDSGYLKVEILPQGDFDLTEDNLWINSQGNEAGQIGLEGNTVKYEGIPIGTAAFDTGVLNVILTDEATTDAVSALVQNITYNNTNVENPAEGLRTIRFSVSDGEAGGLSNIAEMTLGVLGINDAPAITNLDSDVVTFVEDGGPVKLDQSPLAVVTDVDSDDFSGGTLTAEIVNGTGSDVLSIASSVNVVYDEGTGELYYGGASIGSVSFASSTLMTVTFDSANATRDVVSEVIQSITYNNTNSLSPIEGERTVRFQLNDGDGTANGGVETSLFSDVTVTVEGVNDPPAIHDVNGDSLSYYETSGVVLLDQVGTAATVTDADNPNFDGGWLKVEITDGYYASEDILGVRDQGVGVDKISVTGNIIMYGEDQIGVIQTDDNPGLLDIRLYEGADTESVAALIQNITYENSNSVNPTAGERQIEFSLADSTEVGSQIVGGNIVTVDVIQDAASNDPPVIMNLGDSLGYSEGEGAKILDQDVLAVVTDPDSDNFSNGQLTITITGSPTNGEDTLGIDSTGNVTYTGNSIKYYGVEIGTGVFVSGSEGHFDIDLNENADSDAVAALIQNVTYENSNEGNPAEGARTVEFQLIEEDGASSVAQYVTVNVSGVNDKPEIANLHGDVYANYSEGGPSGTGSAILLDAGTDAVVTDLDRTDFDGGHLYIQVTSDTFVEGEDNLGISAGFTFGIVEGTPAYDPSTGLLDIALNASSNESTVSALIQNITYWNSDSTGQTPGNRVIQFTLDDGASEANSMSDDYNVIVTLTAKNDPPEITGVEGHLASYTEEQTTPAYLEAGTTFVVTDVDSDDFAGGRLEVQITGGLDTVDAESGGDVLSIFDSGSGITYDEANGEVSYNGTKIGDVSYTPGWGKLDISLTGEASDTEALNTLVRSITFHSTDTGNPADMSDTRTIRFALWDGDGTANSGSDSGGFYEMTLQVNNVNDSPTISNLGGDVASVTFTEGAAPWSDHSVLLDNGGDAVVTDPDGGDFSGGKLTVWFDPGTFQTGEDSLTFSESGQSLGVYYDTGDGTIEIADDKLGSVDFTESQMTITFDQANSSDVDADMLSSIIQNVRYYNADSDAPTPGDRTVMFQLYDGGYVADPDEGTSIDYSVTVKVEGVNDSPSIDTATWNYGGSDAADADAAGVLYTEGLAESTDIPFLQLQSGPDLIDLDTNPFDGGWLTVEIDSTNYSFADDKIIITTDANISLINGNIVKYDPDGAGGASAVPFGVSNYYEEDGAGIFRVDFNDGASTEAVQALLNHVAYQNVNEGDPTDGLRTIRFQLSDGEAGVNTSPEYEMSIYVSGINDAPELANIDGDRLAFCEKAEGTDTATLDQVGDFSVTDIDIGSNNFSGGTLEVQITGPSTDSWEDLLHIVDDGLINATMEAGKSYTAGNYAASIAYSGAVFATATWDASDSTLDISFDSDANQENVSALLQSIVYANMEDLMTQDGGATAGERTVRFMLDDGDGSDFGGVATGEAEMHIDVTTANDPPAFQHLDSVGFAGFSEGSWPDSGVLVGSADQTYIYVTDADNSTFNGGSLTIEIGDGYQRGEDLIGFSTGGDISMSGDTSGTVGYDGTQIGSYVWTEATGRLTVNLGEHANTESVSALIQNVVYKNLESEDPTPGIDRNIQFTLNDGGEVGSGDCAGEDQTTTDFIMTVGVTAVNDAPEIKYLDSDAVTFVEGAGAVGVDLGSNASVVDVDSDYFSKLEVTISEGGVSNQDALSIRNEGYGDGQIAYDSGNISYEGQFIGTAGWDAATSTFTVGVNQNADAEAVSAVIQNITYDNSPSGTNSVVAGDRTLRFAMWDAGDGTTFGGNAAESSTYYYTTLTVQDTNDKPVIEQLNGDAVTFFESATGIEPTEAAVLLDDSSNAFVTDSDTTDFEGGKLTIQILGGDRTEDMLGFHESVGSSGGGISFTDSGTSGLSTGTVAYEGTVIGDYGWSQNGGLLTVNFTNAGTDAVSELLQVITYYNTDTDPLTTDRTVRFTMWDGDGDTSLGDPIIGAASDPADVIVHIDPVNNGPIITSLDGNSVTYTEESAAVRLDDALNVTISDPDGPDFGGATLSVDFAGGFDKATDELGILNEGKITYNGMTVYYDGTPIGTGLYADTGSLDILLNDNADTAAIAELIKHVTYESSDTENPADPDRRTIRFNLTDGDGATSAYSFVTVGIVNVNDAPSIENIQGDVVTFVEASDPSIGALALDDGADAQVVDVDGATDFDGGMLYVQITSGFNTADQNEDELIIKDTITDGGYTYGIEADGDYTIASTADGVFATASWSAFEHKMEIELASGADTDTVSHLLHHIAYTNNDSDSPMTGDRTVEFWLDDGDGGDSTSPRYGMTVKVEGINDPPELANLDGDSRNYNETDFNGGLMLLDQVDATHTQASVSDIDAENFSGGSLKVDIGTGFVQGEDWLDISDTASINYNEGQGIVRYNGQQFGTVTYDSIEGTLNVVFDEYSNTENVSALIQSISYYNAESDNPSAGDRTIQFTLNDGGGIANDGTATDMATVTVTVETVNDAPEIHNIKGDIMTYSEGSGFVTLDQDVAAYVSDADNTSFNGGRLEVQIETAPITGFVSDTSEDVLGIRNQGFMAHQIAWSGTDSDAVSYGNATIGTAVFDESNSMLTVTFTSDKATPDAVSALIQNITYNNIESEALTAGNRSVRFTLTDDGVPGDPNPATSLVSDMIIEVEALNDAPEIAHLIGEEQAGGSFIYDTEVIDYREGGDPVLLDLSDGVVAPGTARLSAEVTDEDSPNFEGGHLSVDILNPVATEDKLAISTTAANITLQGQDVIYNFENIGAWSYDANDGLLKVDLTEYANESSVAALIQSVTYENTETYNPVEGERNIEFTLYDGDGENGTSEAYGVTVNVIAVNTAPEIFNIAGDSVGFTEGDGSTSSAVLLDQGENGIGRDLDNVDFDGGKLTVAITGGGDPDEDVLSVRNEGMGDGQIGFMGNAAVFHDGDQIGTYLWDGASQMTVTFTDSTDSEALSALIQNVTYNNTDSLDPSTGNRTVRFTLTDPLGSVSADSFMTVGVVGVNDAPVISNLHGDVVTFTEDDNGSANMAMLDNSKGVFPAVTVEDADIGGHGDKFGDGRLEVQIVGNHYADEDMLAIKDDNAGINVDPASNEISYGAAGNTIGTYSWFGAQGMLQIALNNNADETMVSELIASIGYYNTDSLDPTTDDRTVRFVLWDGGSDDNLNKGMSSNLSDVTVKVEGINDPPVIENIHGDSATFTEDSGPVFLDEDLNGFVTDPDSTSFDTGLLTVQITDGTYKIDEDILSVSNQGNITYVNNVVSYSGTPIGTTYFDGDNGTLGITFNEAANTESVSALIKSITYNNTKADSPTAGNRVIEFIMNDGGLNTSPHDAVSDDVVKMTVGVVPVNDKPEIFEIQDDLLNYTEGDGAVVLDQGERAYVVDADADDFNGGHLTVQIVGGFDPDNRGYDVLSINDQGPGSGLISVDTDAGTLRYGVEQIGKYSYDPLTSVLDVEFDDDADEEGVSAVVQNITFNHTETLTGFAGERTVRFTLSDGDGETSQDYDMTVDVSVINNAPVINHLGWESPDNDIASFTEGDGSLIHAKLLDAQQSTADLAATVIDDDSLNFDGGKLTVQIFDGYNPDEDVLTIRNQGDAAYQIGYDSSGGNAITYEGVEIGRLETFDESAGMLTVNLDSDANAESVGALIQNVLYNNTNEWDPTDDVREVRFVLWDGYGDDFGASSDAKVTKVTVTPVNDPPVIHDIQGDTMLYIEGEPAKLIDQDAPGYVEDLDSTDFDEGYLEVTAFDGDPTRSEDDLGVKNVGDGAGQIGVMFDDIITYGGTKIGTVTTDSGGVLRIDFDPTANAESVSALIQNITYENTNDVDPLEGDRTIRFVMSDGDRDMAGNLSTSEYRYATVTVLGVNDPPEIQNLDGDSVTYMKNDGMVVLDQDDGTNLAAVVSDLDSTDFDGGYLEVKVSAGQPEDSLGFQTAAGNITLIGDNVAYNGEIIGTYTMPAGELRVDFNDSADTIAVSELVQSVAYMNTNTLDPVEAVREVVFQLDDGDGNANGGDSLSDAYKVLVDVKGNQPPEVVAPIPDWNIVVDTISRSEADGINLWDTFEDPDDDDTSLTYTIDFIDQNGDVIPDESTPDWLIQTPKGTFIAMPSADDAGETFTVKVTAEDPSAEIAETTFAINVAGPDNSKPVMLEPTDTFTIAENDTSGGVLYTVDATDPDGDALTYSITGGTGASKFQIDAATGAITLIDGQTLDFEDGDKVFELNVRASDGELDDTAFLTVYVQDANDPPEVVQIGTQTLEVSLYENGWFFDVSDSFVDADDDTLTYRAEIDGVDVNDPAAPSWLNFIGSSATFIGIPLPADAGTYTIDLFASDVDSEGNPLNGEVPQTFNIIVVASLDSELRDALYYLDDIDPDEDYTLPEEGEDVGMHEVIMYAAAQTPTESESADMMSESVELDMLEALALLDGDAFTGLDRAAADGENDPHRSRSDDIA